MTTGGLNEICCILSLMSLLGMFKQMNVTKEMIMEKMGKHKDSIKDLSKSGSDLLKNMKNPQDEEASRRGSGAQSEKQNADANKQE